MFQYLISIFRPPILSYIKFPIEPCHLLGLPPAYTYAAIDISSIFMQRPGVLALNGKPDHRCPIHHNRSRPVDRYAAVVLAMGL